MKIFQASFGLVAGRLSGLSSDAGRGLAGPSDLLFGDQYWPVENCDSHSECWASKISKIPGWEQHDVKFLQCDVETGYCRCKQGYMDADDDRYNGCETKINEGKCPFGSCANHGVGHGEQCGAWKHLVCDTTSDNECCTCDDSMARGLGGCVGDEAWLEMQAADCGDKCEAYCNAVTSNTELCLEECSAGQFDEFCEDYVDSADSDGQTNDESSDTTDETGSTENTDSGSDHSDDYSGYITSDSFNTNHESESTADSLSGSDYSDYHDHDETYDETLNTEHDYQSENTDSFSGTEDSYYDGWTDHTGTETTGTHIDVEDNTTNENTYSHDCSTNDDCGTDTTSYIEDYTDSESTENTETTGTHNDVGSNTVTFTDGDYTISHYDNTDYSGTHTDYTEDSNPSYPSPEDSLDDFGDDHDDDHADSENVLAQFSMEEICEAICAIKYAISYSDELACRERCMGPLNFINYLSEGDDSSGGWRRNNLDYERADTTTFATTGEGTTTTTQSPTTASFSACDDGRTNECPENSFCVAAENFVGYDCQCDLGYTMTGKRCRKINDEPDSCPENFKKDLFKMKLDDLRKPSYFLNKGSVMIQVESQFNSRFRLNEETYTGFLEFTRRNCGVEFLKSFAAGYIDVQVMDVAGSEGLYSLVGQRGFYFKNSKGYDGLGGGAIQVTKNFPTLADMTGNSDDWESNQALNAKGKIGPLRDTFYLVMSGDAISEENMGQYIDSCFNPLNLHFFIHNEIVAGGYEILTKDYTRCYYEDKMAAYLDSTCYDPAIINGQLSEDYSMMANLFESDIPQCQQSSQRRIEETKAGPGSGAFRGYKGKKPKKPKKPYSKPKKPKKPKSPKKPNNNNYNNTKPKKPKKPKNPNNYNNRPKKPKKPTNYNKPNKPDSDGWYHQPAVQLTDPVLDAYFTTAIVPTDFPAPDYQPTTMAYVPVVTEAPLNYKPNKPTNTKPDKYKPNKPSKPNKPNKPSNYKPNKPTGPNNSKPNYKPNKPTNKPNKPNNYKPEKPSKPNKNPDNYKPEKPNKPEKPSRPNNYKPNKPNKPANYKPNKPNKKPDKYKPNKPNNKPDKKPKPSNYKPSNNKPTKPAEKPTKPNNYKPPKPEKAPKPIYDRPTKPSKPNYDYMDKAQKAKAKKEYERALKKYKMELDKVNRKNTKAREKNRGAA